MATGLVACGPAAVTPPDNSVSKESSGVAEAAKRAKENSQRHVVQTGASELFVTDEDGKKVWSLRSKSSRFGIDDTGTNQGFLEDVTGTLYTDGKPVSTFKATSAKADTSAHVLKLTGGTEVKSLEYDAVLHADQIEWLDARGLISATGNVTLTSDTWTFGPSAAVYTRPDLTKFGSPDKF